MNGIMLELLQVSLEISRGLCLTTATPLHDERDFAEPIVQ